MVVSRRIFWYENGIYVDFGETVTSMLIIYFLIIPS